MGPPLTPASAADVRAMFARAVCAAGATDTTLGDVTLHEQQIAAIRRGRDALARSGGVLVAHDVGSGKTFIALALARDYARPVILAPAALRRTWAQATSRAQMDIPFISLESLAQGRPPPLGHDVVIIDEAHHVRNPATRTHGAVRQTIVAAHVILLTATPVHNTARDLDTLLSLFLGADARDLSDDDRARLVLRDTGSAGGPVVETHSPVTIGDCTDVVAAVRRLPPPFAPRDGAVAADLLRLSLLRAWCSSAGAFDAMLRRAALRTAALVDAMRAGRHLTRAELTAWSPANDEQLAFIEVIASGGVVSNEGLGTAEAHLAALHALRDLARAHAGVDDQRASSVLEIAHQHNGIGVLACTQYAATVDALWARLRREPGVAALTSHGARIASGAITREDALARFSPVAQGAPTPHERERIRLLIATDLVSEGLNLHDAGVVVHVDLPWTAARIAQRVGRVARFGSPHARVHSHRLSVPRGAEAVLNLARRIHAKRRVAARVVGGDRRLAELLGDTVSASESPAESYARLIQALRPFGLSDAHDDGARVCAIAAPLGGWLALVAAPIGAPRGTHSARLVARLNRGRPSTHPATILRAVSWLVEGKECSLPDVWPMISSEATRWLSRDRAGRLASAARRHAAQVHGRALASTIGSVSSAPPHERARAAQHAAHQLETLGHPSSRSGENRSNEQIVRALVVFCSHDGASLYHSV